MYEVLQFPLVPLTSSWKVDSTKSLPAEQPEGSDLLINLKLQPADCYFGVKTGNLGIILAFFFARITRTSNTYEALSFKHLS